MAIFNIRASYLYLLMALIMLTIITVNGHTDFDRYEIYTRASNRAVINSFKVMETETLWNAAKEKCKGEEAHLVIPDSKEEMDVLRLLLKKLPSNSTLKHFHVGVTDQAEEGIWLSVLGASQSGWGKPWAERISESSTPNTGTNCAVFNGEDILVAKDCETFESPYVCEKEIPIIQPLDAGIEISRA